MARVPGSSGPWDLGTDVDGPHHATCGFCHGRVTMLPRRHPFVLGKNVSVVNKFGLWPIHSGSESP